MKVSVLVLSYNSDIKKLYLTLQSIVKQTIDAFEIVVADDGSKENHKEELIEYFKSCGFTNYKLVMNEENKGTVQNILSGLQYCEGEYVKPISGGDCLYDEDTLHKMYDFMKDNSLDYCHGLVRGYCMTENYEIKEVSYGQTVQAEVIDAEAYFELSWYLENEMYITYQTFSRWINKLIDKGIIYRSNIILGIALRRRRININVFI